MREICLVGNSHVAAIKLGLDLLLADGALSDCDVDIFGASGTRLTMATVRDGCLEPEERHPGKLFEHRFGSCDVLRLDDYDEIYLTVGTRPTQFPHFNPRFVLNYLSPDEPMFRPMSRALVAKIAHHTIHGQWFSPLLEEMIAVSSRPVFFFLGCPFWSTEDRRAIRVHRQLRDDEDGSLRLELAQLQRAIDDAVIALETDRLKFPPPPVQTLGAYRAFTDHAYCTQSRRLTADFSWKHDEQDFRHMNEQYGLEVMRQILSGPERVG